MTDPMTPERLAEIRTAIDAAPRRLAIEPHVYVAGTDCSCPNRHRNHTTGYSLTVSTGDWTRTCSHCEHGILTSREADGVSTLVALAPELLAEVERLAPMESVLAAEHAALEAAEEELKHWRSGNRRLAWPVIEAVPDGMHYAAELVRAQGTEGGDEHDALLRAAATRLRDLDLAAGPLLADRDRLRTIVDQPRTLEAALECIRRLTVERNRLKVANRELREEISTMATECLTHCGQDMDLTEKATLTYVGRYCWRCQGLTSGSCQSDSVEVWVPAEWAEDMKAEIMRREDGE